jgi:hypothetical protein
LPKCNSVTRLAKVGCEARVGELLISQLLVVAVANFYFHHNNCMNLRSSFGLYRLL